MVARIAPRNWCRTQQSLAITLMAAAAAVARAPRRTIPEKAIAVFVESRHHFSHLCGVKNLVGTLFREKLSKFHFAHLFVFEETQIFGDAQISINSSETLKLEMDDRKLGGKRGPEGMRKDSTKSERTREWVRE